MKKMQKSKEEEMEIKKLLNQAIKKEEMDKLFRADPLPKFPAFQSKSGYCCSILS